MSHSNLTSPGVSVTGAERRVVEATGLRHLFEEQWRHLLQLLHLDPTGAPAHSKAEMLGAIESVVAGTDARVRVVGNYKNRLRDGVRGLLDHVTGLVDSLPSSLPVNRAAFRDKQVNAFFVNPQEMRQIFSRSPALRQFFASQPGPEPREVHALLSMSRKEKRIFGVAMMGRLMVREVPQTSVSFGNHELMLPAGNEMLLRSNLKKYLFDSVVDSVRLQMVRYRGGQGSELAGAEGKDPNSPGGYLATLVKVLNRHRELIAIEKNRMSISSLGIKLAPESAAPADELTVHEVELTQSPLKAIVLVRYPRDEMLPTELFL